MKAVVPCPLCNAVIEISEARLNQFIDCPDCDETFRIAALEPIKLIYAFDMDDEANYSDEVYPHK